MWWPLPLHLMRWTWKIVSNPIHPTCCWSCISLPILTRSICALDGIDKIQYTFHIRVVASLSCFYISHLAFPSSPYFYLGVSRFLSSSSAPIFSSTETWRYDLRTKAAWSDLYAGNMKFMNPPMNQPLLIFLFWEIFVFWCESYFITHVRLWAVALLHSALLYDPLKSMCTRNGLIIRVHSLLCHSSPFLRSFMPFSVSSSKNAVIMSTHNLLEPREFHSPLEFRTIVFSLSHSCSFVAVVSLWT